jgi:protein-L-isoaspartate(D-aspartate) O-methyltransferase
MPYYPQAALLAQGIADTAVRNAFARIDRSRFVRPALKASAWADIPLPIEDHATISQPSLVAAMTAWLKLTPNCRVLEIGTGSGYQTALLAELAASVYTIEISDTLARHAQRRLNALEYQDIHFRVGDGAPGWPEAAPFDRIIATVAFPHRPTALLEQLTANGICLTPVGKPWATQQLIQYTRSGEHISEHVCCPVRFLSLQ